MTRVIFQSLSKFIRLTLFTLLTYANQIYVNFDTNSRLDANQKPARKPVSKIKILRKLKINLDLIRNSYQNAFS